MGSLLLVPTYRTTIIMVNIKLTYFDLRARGEPCRLLLAYGGLKYEDERIPPPWDPASTWGTLKPSTPFGQLPLLQWGDQVICQSMACARFIAREVGLAGNNNMESAQVDEKHAEVTVPTALGQLETKLTSRGGQFFVGNNFSWADLHTFMYVSDLPDKSVLKSFPKIANLVERVGNIPNIKNWVETRPVTTM